LNKDFRYQLTVIGTFAQAIVGSEMKDNQFSIKTSADNVKVSWQVTGIRQDVYAKAHRISVEEVKPEKERGSYAQHYALANAVLGPPFGRIHRFIIRVRIGWRGEATLVRSLKPEHQPCLNMKRDTHFASYSICCRL
jgi:hypothetical protein